MYEGEHGMASQVVDKDITTPTALSGQTLHVLLEEEPPVGDDSKSLTDEKIHKSTAPIATANIYITIRCFRLSAPHHQS